MTALIALQNAHTVQTIVDILNIMGMEAKICSEFDDFAEYLKKSRPEIVISDPCIQENSVLELIGETPWSRWIIQDHLSWAAADFLCSQVGCYDILMDVTSDSNIYEVLSSPYKSLSPSGNTGNIAHYRWIRADIFYSSTNDTAGIRDILEQNASDRMDNEFCICIHKRFFSFSLNGCLEQTHFPAILRHIFNEKLTGTLHLWRRSLHWSIAFQNGLPFDMTTNDEMGYFTVASWAQRQKEYQDTFQSEKESIYKSLHAIAQAPQLLKSWMTSLMLELFSWSYGDFLWCPNELPEKDDIFPEFSHEDILNILILGIFSYTPTAFIVEVTQSLLPYFLKLKDNTDRLEAALPESAMPAAEKLRKGLTISELLATMPDDSPIHQAVYFLILMEKLDLNA